MGDDCAVAFTLSDDGYVGLQSVSLLDFSGEPWEHTETILDAFPMGKLRMPENSSEGDIIYEKKNLRLKYVLENSASESAEEEHNEKITKPAIRIRHASLTIFTRANHFPVTSGCASRIWIPWSSQHHGIGKCDFL